MKMLKISAFYLDKQKNVVPNAIFLDNFVSNESCGVQLVLCSGTHHCESMIKFLPNHLKYIIEGFVFSTEYKAFYDILDDRVDECF
jgi:NADH:ubiquinone oxidoreductase subunit F (NADH-binding)